jgi:hypothetical protein
LTTSAHEEKKDVSKMLNLKILLINFKNDFSIIMKELILFSMIYCVNYLFLDFIPKGVEFNKSHLVFSIIISVILLLVYFLVFPINQYFFQKKYSEKKGIKLEYLEFMPYILKYLKFYLIRMVLFVIASILFGWILFFVLSLLNIDRKILVSLITIFLIIVGTIWFYSFLFVGNILVYKREKYISNKILAESRDLIKKNIVFFVLFFIVPYTISLIVTLRSFPNYQYPNQNIIINIFNMIMGLIVTTGSITITVNEVIANSNSYLFKEIEES